MTVSKSTGKPNRIFELTQNPPEDGREREGAACVGLRHRRASSPLAAFAGDAEAVVPTVPLGFPCARHLPFQQHPGRVGAAHTQRGPGDGDR